MDDFTALSISVKHADFVITRRFDAAPLQVFAAWADPVAKSQWFVGPPDKWTPMRRELNFEVGGVEVLEGRFPSGLVTRFDANYRDIVHGRRIVYVYDMHLDERHISVSLSTVEFKNDGAGTCMTYTEQMVLFDGYEDNGGRKRGTEEHFDRIAAMLRNS